MSCSVKKKFGLVKKKKKSYANIFQWVQWNFPGTGQVIQLIQVTFVKPSKNTKNRKRRRKKKKRKLHSFMCYIQLLESWQTTGKGIVNWDSLSHYAATLERSEGAKFSHLTISLGVLLPIDHYCLKFEN